MKIEEYLNSISKKEFIYILISIPIVFFVLYYNFIYPDLEKNKKNEKYRLSQKERQLTKLYKEINHIKVSKNTITPTRKKLENLMDDYKFIKYNMATIKLLYLNDPKTFLLLKQILKKADILRLNASMKVEWIQPSNLFKKGVQIKISGKGKFINIVRYIQYIEYLNALVHINSVNIFTKSKQDLLKYLNEKTKTNSSSLSVIITQYSNKDIEYLRNFAKTHNLKLSISMHGLNAIKMNFTGNYQNIYILNNTLDSLNRNKRIRISNKRVNIYRPRTYFSNKNQYIQNFELTFTIMGVK